MNQLTEFIKPSTKTKLLALFINSKVEVVSSVLLVVAYFAINQITFIMARKYTTYVHYLEKNLWIDFEDSIDAPLTLVNTVFYLMEIFVWLYIFATYVYRNSNDFKFRFWNLVALYFVSIFAFPCYGMQKISYVPVLENKYSNIMCLEASLLALSVGYKFPNKPKYYYLLSIVPIYNFLSIFILRYYVLSQLFALVATSIALNVPLPFIKENEVPIPATYVPDAITLTSMV